jgi:hypothetical protein
LVPGFFRPVRMVLHRSLPQPGANANHGWIGVPRSVCALSRPQLDP